MWYLSKKNGKPCVYIPCLYFYDSAHVLIHDVYQVLKLIYTRSEFCTVSNELIDQFVITIKLPNTELYIESEDVGCLTVKYYDSNPVQNTKKFCSSIAEIIKVIKSYENH